MNLQVYISFNGNCRKALEFYSRVFEAKINKTVTYKELPSHPKVAIEKDVEELIAYSSIILKGNYLNMVDVFPGMPLTRGNNVSLTIVSNKSNELEVLFNKLKEDGNVNMELQKTYWSRCYGSLTDKFGIEWHFNCEE
ncbi:PhnB protein [Clostridium acetobutylicum]|uniref:Uncharacterized protein, homolog of PHNB E.coli n=1 Tax=Clostridium acetobutylicum (strain ATCC 824 / DSM 792 / JCM 1419 / IAM 19013 / LMG 5710 / NBRC 13948 / NRRL B-527 / VKM B-1787 / 2291 / W) TaxID=272562 RepID=Q97IW5_CLOAB|nr:MULTISPECIES: glyoxalase/bleomycin resistance/extradiol dioxygenase family protein [Clostridium]AAK79492.1 Uncharacterized protein, homolog of PHNB E.coli [Clostridium acetobutylicum ATCC 824]ADZ20577.1 Conserved hypothetical protein [Clostridium acetobutylicum EA 2018]AEI34581.1 hypothetical protein SMB_G1550 [Clostridium acetobutylicum DSM 1731]AWV81263.1 VOC family protein [Clostridium acetobutylicum]MBC2392897.1 glyoxalase/bleomycin resistance/extradiol dioxygenase family protein [Clost